MTDTPHGYTQELHDHIRDLVVEWKAKGEPGSPEDYVRQQAYGNPLFVALFLIPGVQALIAWLVQKILTEEFGNGDAGP